MSANIATDENNMRLPAPGMGDGRDDGYVDSANTGNRVRKEGRA